MSRFPYVRAGCGTRVATLLVAVSLLIPLACSGRNEPTAAVALPDAEDTIPSQQHGCPYRLRIDLVGVARTGDVRVRAEVTNTSSEVVHWDSEFSALLSWRVFAQGHGDWLESADAGGRIAPTKRSRLRERFVPLRPGQALTKEFALTDRVRVLTGYSSQVMRRLPDGRRVCREEFDVWEEWRRYLAYKSVRVLEIHWVYDATTWRGDAATNVCPLPSPRDYFQELFHFQPEELPLGRGLAASNTLVVRLADGGRGR